MPIKFKCKNNRAKSALVTVCLLFVSLLFSGVSQAAGGDAGNRLLRFADIHKDKITFVYAGDIYVGDIHSGESLRLTSHVGVEMFPKFSRSGDWIAFTAEYSGSRQLYKMKTDGSGLEQLTWYNDVGAMPPRGGFDYRVLDWSADDKQILVRANRLPWSVRMGQPYWVPVDGGLATPLAVPETGGGMLSPDGKKFVYTPIDREFRTWKRYRGGRAQDVWIYDLEKNASERLTSHPGTDNQPVWIDDKIFFLSDRDYTLNLYQYQKGGEPKKLTDHKAHDSLWASAGPQALVYENDGYLWRFDPKTNKAQKLSIHVRGNPQYLLAQYKNVVEQIESMDIAKDGKRALFGARGELFSVPAKKGEVRNISRTPKSREIAATWSPDGKMVAYLSDKTGEYEVYVRAQNGEGEEQRLTNDGTIWRFPPVWSPDSKKLAFSDKNQTLWSLEVKSKKLRKLDRAQRNDIQDYSWSPDSQWLTYSKREDNGFGSIWVYHLKTKTASQLSSKLTSEQEPVFGANGNYLFFLSNRDYNLSFSSFEFNYLYHKATRVYAAQLNASAPELYPYQSDEVELTAKNKKKKNNDKDNAKSKAVKIDLDGFDDRVVALPGKAGNYFNLQANGDKVFVMQRENGTSQLRLIDLEKSENPKIILSGVNDYRLAAKGENILVRRGDKYAIVAAKAKQKFDDGKLDLSKMELKIDPKTEWQQMYVDGWRILRDWFYDPNIHGMDWDGVRAKYQPWVDAATHRTDLDYAFGEIAGELNSGHVYVNVGEQPKVERRDNGLLGAQLSAHKSGYFKFDKIFKGENWHQSLRSPLTQPGIKAAEGDYLIAIDGISLRSVKNPYQLLESKADRFVTLTVNKKPSGKGSWVTQVKPIKRETNLRYLDWVKSRAAMVDKLSGGRIGYVHLPNTAVDGNRELFKQFVPQITKDALIIDDRYNGGGFIPDRMIEMLSRKTLNYWKYRGLEPNATPLIAHDGPKAMLINGYSSSGGDALPYYFRKQGLGKLIGTRTWGGLIGISGNPALADGGLLLASTFRVMDPQGNWVVENEGVSPDIEVIDRPELVYAGRDPSLERAVKELMQALKENPRASIKAPAAPTQF